MNKRFIDLFDKIRMEPSHCLSVTTQKDLYELAKNYLHLDHVKSYWSKSRICKSILSSEVPTNYKILTGIRKTVLGRELYNECVQEGGMISEERLKARLNELQTMGQLKACNIDTLIKLCSLKDISDKDLHNDCITNSMNFKDPNELPTIESETLLLQRIMYDISKLEGPVRAHILVPTDKAVNLIGHRPPILILLGDVHEGNQKCESMCNIEEHCFSLYDPPSSFLQYLDDLAKQGITTDIYSELWVSRKTGEPTAKTVFQYNSALTESEKAQEPCWSHKAYKKDCKFKYLRMHYSDPRFVANEGIDSIMRQLAIRNNYDEFFEYIQEYFPGAKADIIMNMIYKRLEVGTAEFIRKYAGTYDVVLKYSKIFKQTRHG